MSAHLTFEQFSESILGESTGEADAHLRECAACQAELQRWKREFRAFGSAVRSWSTSEAAAVSSAEGMLAGRGSFPKQWQTAAAWVVILIVCLFAELHNFRGRAFKRSPHIADPEISDTVLMKEVNAELSRDVPGPMEPLSKLMDGGATDSLQ